MLRDCMLSGQWIDDRPVKAVGFEEQLDAETSHFAEMKVNLQAKYGDPKEPYIAA